MKAKKNLQKITLLLLLVLAAGCATQYEAVTLTEETPVYKDKAHDKAAMVIIPMNSQAYLSKGEKKYKKIKYGSYEGWTVNPNWYKRKTQSGTYSGGKTSSTTSSTSSSSSKSVQVKGYTRKDGTYVKPHTRSAPRRR